MTTTKKCWLVIWTKYGRVDAHSAKSDRERVESAHRSPRAAERAAAKMNKNSDGTIYYVRESDIWRKFGDEA